MPPAPASSFFSAAVLAVLSDRSLLSHITSFQQGVPLLIHELIILHAATHPLPPNVRVNRLWRSVMVCGDLQAVKLLYRMRLQPQYTQLTDLHMSNVPKFAMGLGRLDVLKWFDETGVEPAPWPPALMADAVFYKHFDMAAWLLENRPDTCQADFTKAMARAAEHGQLQLLLQLIAVRPEALTAYVMDAAFINRHWDVIYYLHEHSPAGCSPAAMDYAAERGHLDVIKFLHENRSEGCTTRAMEIAAYHGNLEIVRFLHEHRTEGCTPKAMDYAAGSGHLEVVRFLHENRTEGCTTAAIDSAARNGHLEVVQFLRENRDEGMDQAIAEATRNGHHDVVAFLRESLETK